MRWKRVIVPLLCLGLCAHAKVELGIDVLSGQSFECLQGKRVGLLTHAAGVNGDGVSTIKVLLEGKVNLVALYAPEHGLYGSFRAGEAFPNSKEALSGLSVYAAYGENAKPPKEWLEGVNVVVIDLQDVGIRYYTYVSSMLYMMAACFENDIEVVVLDRPNPLGGELVGGPGIDPDNQSFLGAFPVPLIHGLTMGELALFAKTLDDWTLQPNAYRTERVCGLNVSEATISKGNLKVIPMNGWKRSMRWEDTELAWHATSPRIQDITDVYDYSVLSLGTLAANFLKQFSFQSVNGHAFRRFSAKTWSSDNLLEAIQALSLSGLTVKRVDEAYIDVIIDDFKAVEPATLSAYMLYWARLQNKQPFALDDESEILLKRHLGDSAFWQNLQSSNPNPTPFIQKWSAAAATFHKNVTKLY
ncbi:MAG: hypothetical protein A2Y14_04290 [Verrucomicrobia bacterium GWF2_51_19]|nr:MAG: hypothetical protein A2Y14_04290 [Verrucomicrobia bacterium GWF2_51_19]HCJ12228.1 DUF1343 domain-containing protein [Opitutae bacterium]